MAMSGLSDEVQMRREFRFLFFGVIAFYCLMAYLWPQALWSLVVIAPVMLIGLRDYTQKRHSVLRNFPIIGHFRYLLEMIRPEINQYFIESNHDGLPFSREMRSLVYQRAKKERDTLPFGTQKDVYAIGYEWVNHSLSPHHLKPEDMRVKIGGPDCKQPYMAALLNISAMSYGAISKNAVRALNLGAKIGGFYHNTGEGAASPYHFMEGGDLVYQLGTGYFGSRASDGRFSEEKFRQVANRPEVKMIEIKLSQGAKPGHGGILPAAKLTQEIASIRGVEMGRDVLSPPAHTAFTTPVEMMHFIKQLRSASGGKPIGFKLCLGKRREFISICKAMLKTGIKPDFITVDGGEGGTGAAPLEFSNSVGTPLREALIFVHNALVGFNLRDDIRLIASGKVVSGMDLVANLALGADICNSARGMMMALGCIQALRCNSNTCPVGIATQDEDLMAGLDVEIKSKRVANFQHETVKSAAELIGAMGVSSSRELRPWHLNRRVDQHTIRHYGELYEFIKPGSLLNESNLPETFARAVLAASADSFESLAEKRERHEAPYRRTS